MATLGEAGNTQSPALMVLRIRGYRLRESYNEQGEGFYSAFKDTNEFVAFSPEALLGIVSIWETFGEDWQSAIHPFEFDEIEEYSQDADGHVTGTITDENGTRRFSY